MLLIQSIDQRQETAVRPDRSKVAISGAIPKGCEFESHSCHFCASTIHSILPPLSVCPLVLLRSAPWHCEAQVLFQIAVTQY